MNPVTRGVRNAFRNPTRTIAIILMLGMSIGLIVAMLAARQAISTKIEEVKGSVGNTVTIAPAGVRGFEGGGSALSTDAVAAVSNIDNVTSVMQTLSDRLTTDDTTNLESSVELGALGQRRMGQTATPSDSSATGMPQRSMTPALTVTGTDDVSSPTVFGGTTVEWTEGEVFDATSSESIAAIGTKLAEKNGLSVGDTFTAYGTEVTVVGIYDAGTDFANNGIFMPLATLQTLSDQQDAVTSAVATIDSLDNLSAATDAITAALGDSADITSSQETADQLIAPLQSVEGITLFSLVGAVIAGAAIILLTMTMIVRERRKEIGVMKAVGASNKGIMGQFVSESLTLTTAGLVIGLLAGVAIAGPLTNSLVSNSSEPTTASQTGPGAQGGTPRGGFGGGPRGATRATTTRQVVTNITTSVGTEVILSGILFALIIAALGSALPAYFISNVKPAEAMRNE